MDKDTKDAIIKLIMLAALVFAVGLGLKYGILDNESADSLRETGTEIITDDGGSNE